MGVVYRARHLSLDRIVALKVLGPDTLPFRSRKPRWFKVPPPGGERYRELDRMIRDAQTHALPEDPMDRERIARYGVNIRDVQDVIVTDDAEAVPASADS